MQQDIPEWLKQLLLVLVTSVTGGVAWYAKGKRAARERKESLHQAALDKLEAQNEAERATVKSLLRDAIAEAVEKKEERAERLAMDKQLAIIWTAVASTLQKNEILMAKVENKLAEIIRILDGKQ